MPRRADDDRADPVDDELLSAVQRLGRLMASRQVSTRIAEVAGADISQQGVQIVRALLRDGECTIAGLAAANTTDDRGPQLMQLWQQSGKAAPFVIAEVMQVVHVGNGAPADAGSDGPPTGFDAGIDHTGGGGGGCGCAAADVRSTGGLTSLIAVALVAALRRRRRH